MGPTTATTSGASPRAAANAWPAPAPGYRCPAIGEGRTSTGLTFPSRYCHPARGEDRGCRWSDENGRGATEAAGEFRKGFEMVEAGRLVTRREGVYFTSVER